MILPVSPVLHLAAGSPPWLTLAAGLALFLHIGGGGVGLVSGAAALSFRKGGRAHRWAGTVFFVAMLTMAGVAAIVAPFTARPSNMVGGMFTAYLVVTAWATVRRRPGEVGVFEVGAFLLGLAAIAGGLALIGLAASDPARILGGQPVQALYLVVAVMGLAAALDLKVILRGGVRGAQRIARHLWRMGLALSIASASFFIGQPRVFPAALRGSPLIIALAVAPLVAMIFWLLKVRFTNPFKAMRAPFASPGEPVAASGKQPC
jgi:hypothetical protein